jgi:probable F420-dependent oxidoreductase
MKIDVSTYVNDATATGDLGRYVEDQGLDGLWTAEVGHNPFIALTLAAQTTDRITLGTQIAVAFARSPMTVANIAWDLQTLSKGRFILGLGTQVRAHIQKRFGMDWANPASRLREYIEGLRAIWDNWQNGTLLKFEGEHYTFTLMTPFFNPGPIDHPDIPIYIAGVNEKNCHLAGALCQGIHAHGFHTTTYLQDVLLSNVNDGLKDSGRKRDDFEMVVPIFTVTGRDDNEMQKQIIATKARIAFYASTPSYKVVMDTHGWGETREKLSGMARQGKWDDMWKEISDEMLETIAVVAPPGQLREKIEDRYTGIADRVCIGWDDETDQDWFVQSLTASA